MRPALLDVAVRDGRCLALTPPCRHASPRPELARGWGSTAWLTVIASVIASLVVRAPSTYIDAAAAGWHLLAKVFCRSVMGHACAPPSYRRAIFEVPLAAAALGAALTTTMLAWRYARFVRRSQQRTRAHADAARITGRRLPAVSSTVVLDDPQPAASACPADRPPSSLPLEHSLSSTPSSSAQ